MTQRAKYKQNDPKQQRFLRNLPMFVASSLQSFSVVDDEEFRNMIMDLDFRIVCPSRKHLSTKLIPDKALEMQKSLISQLSDCTELSMTIDIWTNRQMRSYIGITAHFIRDWKLQNAMLVCKRFTGRHTADNIVAQYEEVINAFHIRGKITNIVTDNASNMIKAFRFKDGLKEADTIKAVIAKASSIVGCVRRSTINTEMLEECRKLQASNITRWNSELTMIQSLLRIPHEKIDELNLAHKLSQYERIILTELCDLLAPFGTATDYTQGDKVVTASLVIPSIRGLKAQLLNVNVQYTEPVRAALLKSIDRRLSAHEDKNSFQMAAILDPRFKLVWCHSKQESSEMKNCLMTAVDVINSSSAVPASSPESPPRKRCKLFSFMATAATQATLPTDIACKEEVETYLSQPCLPDDTNPMEFWKTTCNTHPTLAKLAEKCLIVPATSAPVERVLSTAGKIFRPDRCQLSDERFETLMFIKCNKHLLK